MWFLHHVNLSSNHGASLGDPTFPDPQILFFMSAHRDFAKLEEQLWCIYSDYNSVWFFLGHISYSIKKNHSFFSLSFHVYFCIIMEFKSKYSHTEYFLALCLLFWYFHLYFISNQETCSACSGRCGYSILLGTFIGLEPYMFPALHWIQLPPGTSVSIQTWLELQVLVCLVILRGCQVGH